MIVFFILKINVFSQDVKILYPTPNDKIPYGETIQIHIQNPLSIAVNVYYRFEKEDWILIEEDYRGTSIDFNVPQSNSSNIYFKVLYFDIDQPALYWHEQGAHFAELRSGLFTPSGNFILTSSADRYIKLWNFNQKALVREVNLGSMGSVLYSAPLNDNIAAVAVDSFLVIVDFSQSNAVIKSINTGSLIRGIDCTELNGGMIAATSSNGFVHLYDTQGEILVNYKVSDGDVIYTTRFSRDGKYLCFASYEGRIDCIDIIDDNLIFSESGHGTNQQNKTIWSVDIMPDNKKIISGGVDGTARVWDIATGAELNKYDSHSGHVRSVRCSPDGKLMVSGSLDGTLRQYNALNLNEFKSIVVNHGSPVISVDYSPDSKFIISSGRGNDFKVWRNFEQGDVLDTVKAEIIRKFSIYIPDLTVNLNEQFNIPVISSYNTSDIVFDKESYNIELLLELPVLMVDVKDFNTKQKVDKDTITLKSVFYPNKDTLVNLSALSLLGPSNYGEIRILSIKTEENLNINSEDGSITINGNCPGDIERNIIVEGNPASMILSPNPTSDFLNINLTVVEDDNYKLTIFDINSQIVFTQNMGFLKPGTYNFTVDMSQILNGYFNLSISGKRFIFKSQIVISK